MTARGAHRTRAGFALGGGVALGVVLAAFAPAALVAALLWPRSPAASATSTTTTTSSSGASTPAAPRIEPPRVDFAAIKQAAQAPATQALIYDRARVDAERLLLKKIARARDARRAAGGTLQDLRKPFSVDDLGGAPAMAELGVAAGKRLLVSRPDGKLVAPTGASLPAGVELSSKERDEDTIEADATLDGKPVRVLRRCVAGEHLCLVDIEAHDDGGPAARARFDAVVDAEQSKLEAWTPPAPPAPPALPAAPPLPLSPAAAVAAGAALALLLAAALAFRLRAVGGAVLAAAARLRAVSAGSPREAPAATLPEEIAALERAVDEAAAALGDAGARAALDKRRAARAEAVAAGLTEARTRLDARVAADDADDAALAALVTAANALVESFEARVVRWQSHAGVIAAPPAISDVETRAQALVPLPGLMLEAAQRLLRVARAPGVPPKIVEELASVGRALAERGKNAQTLVDQLLLDAATDRKGERPVGALEALRAELSALAPAPAAPTAVAALQDLPPAEIAKRFEERP